MKQAKALELKIAELEDQRRALDRQATELGGQYLLSSVVFLIGLVLIFFTSLWWLGLFLLAVGALAALTQGAKKRKAQKASKELDEQIATIRKQVIKKYSAD